MTPTALAEQTATDTPAPYGSLGEDLQSTTEKIILAAFIAIPFVAVLAAVPIA